MRAHVARAFPPRATVDRRRDVVAEIARRRGPLGEAQEAVALFDVHVHVPETGEHGLPLRVDDLVAGRRCELRAHVLHLAAIDHEDGCVVDRLLGDRVEEPRVHDREPVLRRVRDLLPHRLAPLASHGLLELEELRNGDFPALANRRGPIAHLREGMPVVVEPLDRRREAEARPPPRHDVHRRAVLREGRVADLLDVRAAAGEERDAIGAGARGAEEHLVDVHSAVQGGVESARPVALVDGRRPRAARRIARRVLGRVVVVVVGAGHVDARGDVVRADLGVEVELRAAAAILERVVLVVRAVAVAHVRRLAGEVGDDDVERRRDVRRGRGRGRRRGRRRRRRRRRRRGRGRGRGDGLGAGARGEESERSERSEARTGRAVHRRTVHQAERPKISPFRGAPGPPYSCAGPTRCYPPRAKHAVQHRAPGRRETPPLPELQTSRQNTTFAFVTRLMLSIPGATIHTLRELFEDGATSIEASPFAEHIRKLDPTSQAYFENQFFTKTYTQTKQQIARRLYSVLQVPAFDRMFASKTNKLDMFDALQNGSIVLINTSKTLLKSDASALFGRYMIARVIAAAFERIALSARRTQTGLPHRRRGGGIFRRRIWRRCCRRRANSTSA